MTRLPTPLEIRTFRLAAGLTQAAAAALVYRTSRIWQMWEAGDRPIDLGLWELVNIKVKRSARACPLHIEFMPDRREDRAATLTGIRNAIKAAVRQNRPRTFNQEQLAMMLIELAKNTFDHSTGIGILDMQFPDAGRPMLVTYRDTGAPFEWNTETGVSSKAGNGVNMGLGLSFVRQSAAAAGFELSIARVNDATEFRIALPQQARFAPALNDNRLPA